MARPKKDDAERKGRYLQVRVTDDEKAAFDDAAALEGLDTSTWVRLRLRTTAKKELEQAGKKVAFIAGQKSK